jgi:chromosome segregation ATPase
MRFGLHTLWEELGIERKESKLKTDADSMPSEGSGEFASCSSQDDDDVRAKPSLYEQLMKGNLNLFDQLAQTPKESQDDALAKNEKPIAVSRDGSFATQYSSDNQNILSIESEIIDDSELIATLGNTVTSLVEEIQSQNVIINEKDCLLKRAMQDNESYTTLLELERHKSRHLLKSNATLNEKCLKMVKNYENIKSNMVPKEDFIRIQKEHEILKQHANEMSRAVADYQSLKRSSSTIQSELGQLKEQNLKLNMTADKYELQSKQVDELKCAMEVLQKEKSKLEHQLQRSLAQEQKMQQMIHSLEQNQGQLVQKINHYEVKNEELGKLASQVHNYENQILNLKQQISSQRKDFESRLIDEQERNQTLISERNNSKSLVEVKSKELECVNKNLRMLQTQFASQSESFHLEIAALQHQLSESKLSEQGLKNQLSNFDDHLSAKQNDIQAELLQLKNSIKSQIEENQKLKHSKRVMADDFKRMLDDCRNSICCKFTKICQEKDQKIQEITKKVEDLEHELCTMEQAKEQKVCEMEKNRIQDSVACFRALQRIDVCLDQIVVKTEKLESSTKLVMKGYLQTHNHLGESKELHIQQQEVSKTEMEQLWQKSEKLQDNLQKYVKFCWKLQNTMSAISEDVFFVHEVTNLDYRISKQCLTILPCKTLKTN